MLSTYWLWAITNERSRSDVAVLLPGLDGFFGLLGAQQLFGLLRRLRRPLALGLELLELVQLLDVDDGSAPRKPVAAHEGTLLALAYNQLALFALVAGQARRLRRGFGRQDVALLVQLENRLAVGVAAAPVKDTLLLASQLNKVLSALGAGDPDLV